MNFYQARRNSIKNIQTLLQWWLNENFKDSDDSKETDQSLVLDSNYSTKATLLEPKSNEFEHTFKELGPLRLKSRRHIHSFKNLLS